ncbi:sigma-70 family RNA polymerase sigma factor [Lysinibacillus sp. KU-BSD001]|uniref:sigma-70 family RNA polymerase sigma factor n=1 Tax=Lysinibacillus sp. KU-BSD001 TaxID=3141328 RepID=UPI0036E0C817
MLIEEYGEYIYHLAYLYVKDKQVAEEITQDVFYTYSVKRNQFRGDASIKTYLTRIVINKSHDELRKMKRQTVLQAILPFMKTVRSAEQEVLAKVQGESLKEAVWNMPVHYREVMIFYYYEDFTINEIVSLLGISENTIRTRLRRGRELLKQQLTNEGEVLLDGQF